MEDFQSHVWLEMNSRWFHLADYTTLYHEIIDFFNEKMDAYNGLRYYNRDGTYDPMLFTKPGMLYEPLIIDNQSMRKVEDRYIEPNLKAWEEFRNAAIIHPNQSF